MGLFRYEAIDKNGKVVRGVMKASDEQQVTTKLASMGYAARSIYSGGSAQQANKTTSSAATAPGGAAGQGKGIAAVTIASGVPVSIKSKVRASQLAVFFRQLATLVRSGMPLGQSFNNLVVRDRQIGKIMPLMHEKLLSGQKLSGVMAEHPGIFPVHAIASVWAGEMAGKLEIALDEIATDFETEASDTRRGRIGWGLSKLQWGFFVLLIPASNLMALLLPVYQKSLDDPSMKQKDVLAYLGKHFMQTMFWKSMLVIVAMIAFWIAWGYIKRIPAVRWLLDGLLLRAPLWGKLHHNRALARFLHVLDGLYAAGINPGAAWDAASLTPRNSVIAGKLRLLRAQLPPDAGLQEMCSTAGLFEPEDLGLVAAGEKTGQVPEVLANLSTVYADRASAIGTTGKAVSFTIFTTTSLILGGVIILRLWASYINLAFEAADIIGR